MFMHPEIMRVVAAQRSQDMQAKAGASRRIAEARAARRSDRARTARFRWLARRTTARRPAIVYSPQRDA